MRLYLKYFGQIAEICAASEETIEFSGDTISELSAWLIKKYPQTTSISYKVAVNHNLISGDDKLEPNAIIAFLPPFAGG